MNRYVIQHPVEHIILCRICRESKKSKKPLYENRGIHRQVYMAMRTRPKGQSMTNTQTNTLQIYNCLSTVYKIIDLITGSPDLDLS